MLMPRPPSGRDVDDGIGVLLDPGQEFHEHLRVAGRAAVGHASVQMDDRGAGLGRVDRLLCDLVGRDRQMRGHRRRVDRAGDGAGDDDFRLLGHGVLPSRDFALLSTSRRIEVGPTASMLFGSWCQSIKCSPPPAMQICGGGPTLRADAGRAVSLAGGAPRVFPFLMESEGIPKSLGF